MEEQITLLNDLERLNSEMDLLFSNIQGKDESSASRIKSLEQQLAESRLLMEKISLAAEGRERDLNSELSVYRSDNIARSAEIERLKSAGADLQARVETLSGLLEEERDAAKGKDVFLSSARSALKDKEGEVSKVWAMFEEVKNDASGLKAVLQAKDAEIAASEKRLLAAASENKNLTAGLKELQERLNAASRALKDEKDALRSLEAQKTELMAALDGTRAEVTARAAAAHKFETSLVEVQIRLDSALKLLEEERLKNRENLVFINSAKSSLKDKDAEAAKIWNMLEEAKARSADLQNLLKNKEAELERSARSRQDLELELQKAAAAAVQTEQGFSHKIDLLRRELKEKRKDSENSSRRFAELEKNGEEAFTELLAAREELKSLKARALEIESALVLERNKSRKFEQDIQLLSSKAHKAGSEPKIGRLLEQKDEIIANLTGKISELENSERDAKADHAAGLKAAEEARQDLANVLRHKEEEAGSIQGRVRSLEKEAAYAEEKWRLAEAQLNNAAAHISERENELEILRGRLASVESEKEYHKRAALEAQKTVTDLSGAADKNDSEKTAKLYGALKTETDKYNRLLARSEEMSARLGELESEKNRLAAENERLAARGQVFAGANQQELEELGRKLKSRESELESARSALEALKKEYDGLFENRKALQEKYAAELRAENAMLEEARRNIGERDELISGLTRSGGETLRETEKLKAEKESLAAALSNLKDGEDKELRRALKDSEKLLKAKEQKLSKITFDLEKVKNDKASLIEHERRLKDDLRSRPYRALLKEAEDRLLQKETLLLEMQEKMESVARDSAALERGGSMPDNDLADLLSGISHQVSNSVGIIRSNAEFCLEAPEAADIKESLGAIVRNIITLQKKIEDMLEFSRPVALQYVETRLRAAAEEALAGFAKSRDLSGVRVSFLEDPGLKAVKADRVRLVSALEQIFMNAVDAMPGGGELTVSLKNGPDAGQIIEITDTGDGIEPKNLAAVFHPFFTTRPGKMGLGLALAKNIIKAHGGSIKISSPPGRGAVVSIALPAQSAKG